MKKRLFLAWFWFGSSRVGIRRALLDGSHRGRVWEPFKGSHIMRSVTAFAFLAIWVTTASAAPALKIGSDSGSPRPAGRPLRLASQHAGASQRQGGESNTAARSGPSIAEVGNRSGDEVPPPDDRDRDKERIQRMQESIADILHNRTLARLLVGLRIVSARTGRLFYGRRDDALMDPASNQKLLATTTALIRLGADWRFRTAISGPEVNGDGVIAGNVHLRGNGDPSLRMADLENLATRLRDRGVVRIDGGVIADPRRFGDEGGGSDDEGPARAPLVIDRGITFVRVRPGATLGAPAMVLTDPPQPADGDASQHGFLIRNQAVTRESSRRTRVTVRISVADGRLRFDVAGSIGLGSAGVAFRRRVPHPALHAAVLLRAALIGAGINIRDPAGTGPAPPPTGFVEVHRSPPLEIVLRKINKDSDNDQAERVLQTVGAEIAGGAATTEKGLVVLREVIGSLGLRPGSYVSKNGSGLGHANRITPHAMADLLRALYLDPRVGPEILQSLSVGGIDGTTRNRFKGTLAARRVRAKTGTLNGKSCLSGLVGDGDDVMAFSMMVQGFRGRSNLHAVRASQVGAVNAMMRYVREGTGERTESTSGVDEQQVGADFETGGEAQESGEEGEGEGEGSDTAMSPGEDPVDSFLRKSRSASPPANGAGGNRGVVVPTGVRGGSK